MDETGGAVGCKNYSEHVFRVKVHLRTVCCVGGNRTHCFNRAQTAPIALTAMPCFLMKSNAVSHWYPGNGHILPRVDTGLWRGDYEGQLARSQNVAGADSVPATKVRLGHKLHS